MRYFIFYRIIFSVASMATSSSFSFVFLLRGLFLGCGSHLIIQNLFEAAKMNIAIGLYLL